MELVGYYLDNNISGLPVTKTFTAEQRRKTLMDLLLI
jgi:hypothetical protein